MDQKTKEKILEAAQIARETHPDEQGCQANFKKRADILLEKVKAYEVPYFLILVSELSETRERKVSDVQIIRAYELASEKHGLEVEGEWKGRDLIPPDVLFWRDFYRNIDYFEMLNRSEEYAGEERRKK